MKSIIYTGATGAGHTLAARSLKNALTECGEDAFVIDGFKEGGKIIDKTITKGYEQLVENWPKLYRKLYSSFDNESKATEVILRQASKILEKKLLADIEEYDPDLIVSTHPIITNILGILKDEGKIDKPLLAFVTDFVIHDLYLKDSVDAYIVGSDYTKETMIDKNVPEEKIFVYGIPVREAFRTAHEHENAVPSILLMAGSLGSKQLRKAFLSLLKSKSVFDLNIICGQNKQIKSELERLRDSLDPERSKNITISGYVENIAELMDNADVIITKPGGLTSTEAICKNVPIIIPYTYPGVEEYNRDYLVSKGMAFELSEIEDLSLLVDEIAVDPNVLENMKKNMKEEASYYSIEKTVKLCQDLAANASN